MALFAVLMCVNFASCSTEGETPVNDEEVYTVKLGLGGEILDITDEPLSRATTNNLYGIQVYSIPNKELGKGENIEWTRYAYGLFDNPDEISINLLKGYKYKFEATMVVDGKNKISNNHGNANEYWIPFNTSGDNGGRGLLSNLFEYESSTYFGGLGLGETMLSNGDYGKHPNTDRYYGELIDFIPTDGKQAQITMKRASFGASFVVINSLFKDGVLEIKMANAPIMEINFSVGELDEFWTKDIFTFSDVAAVYKNDNHTETISVTINWLRSDGAKIPLGTHDITYKRNRNTIVTVLIKNAGMDNALGFSIEATEQVGIDDMAEDGNTTIEDGEIVNTPVNPN